MREWFELSLRNTYLVSWFINSLDGPRTVRLSIHVVLHDSELIDFHNLAHRIHSVKFVAMPRGMLIARPSRSSKLTDTD